MSTEQLGLVDYIREKEKMNDTPRIPMQCSACAQRWSLNMPRAEIANNPQTSVISVAHEKVVRCISSKCRQPFIIAIAGAQIQYQVIPVEESVAEQIEGTRIVKPELSIVGGN